MYHHLLPYILRPLTLPHPSYFPLPSLRTIKRLTEEAAAMRQLVPGVTDSTVPDRTTLTRTIMAWEETVTNLLEQQRMFSVSDCAAVVLPG